MAINPAERVEQKAPIASLTPQKVDRTPVPELVTSALEAIAAAGSAQLRSCPTKKKGFIIPNEGLGIKEKFGMDDGLYHQTCLNRAKKGDAVHMTAVGMNYYHGKCVKENIVEAEKWFRAAAKKGSSKAMAHLGELFTYGKETIQPDPEQGLMWYKQAAEHEKDPDPVAMKQLGSYYEEGKVVEKDLKYAERLYKKAALPPYEYPPAAAQLALLYVNNEEWKDSKEAVKWFHISAELKQPVGMYHFGLALAEGRHVHKDLTEAKKWLTLAAKHTEVARLATWHLGNLACQEENVPLAILWFTKAAAMKCIEAKRSLALLYAHNEKVKDISKAIQWYTEADQEDDLFSTNNLGVLLYTNQLDDKRAVELFTKGANKEQSNCMSNLGECFYEGRGVAQDLAQALKWFTKAAEKNVSSAMVFLGRLHLEFPDYYDEKKSTEWFHKAAKLGNRDGMHHLASALSKGRGTEIDLFKALKWERKALQKGHPNIQYSLGNLYAETGHFEQAARCFLKEAEAGHIAAMYDFAYCCEKGLGVPLDVLEAVKWYRQAALADDTDAMCKLGTLFFTLKDHSKAIKWLTQAAEKNHGEAKKALLNLFKTPGFVHELPATEWLKYIPLTDEDSEAFLKLGELFLETKDYLQAIEWLTKAANAKDEKAIRLLSEIYTTVDGFKDDSLAIKWLTEVFFNGDRSVGYKLGTLLLSQKSEQAGARYLREAARNGNLDAMNDLINFYSKSAFNDDRESFLFWLAQAAIAGDVNAMYKLGMEQISKAKEEEALSWLRKAADAGHPVAKEELTKRERTQLPMSQALAKTSLPIEVLMVLVPRYLTGEGTHEEHEQAVSMLKLMLHEETEATMSWLKTREASYLLGKMYEKGVGVLKNRELAKAYYHHAIVRGHLDAMDALADLFPGIWRERWAAHLQYRIDHFKDRGPPAS